MIYIPIDVWNNINSYLQYTEIYNNRIISKYHNILTKNYICKYIIDSHYITDKQIKNFNIGDTFFIVSQSGTNYYSPYINKKLVLIGKEPWINYNKKGIIFSFQKITDKHMYYCSITACYSEYPKIFSRFILIRI